ncbi:hypothetical protein [uncultured Microbulbifer sp.]|uniref:hypothetical protein n=1 Tax=uncultured Microbulbifer sp. TaxID=348147 RepID=UPI0026033A66|nr:hypothetical protein [uncultured Microbulbifer sp.]
MSEDKAILVRNQWEKSGTKMLKMSKRPSCDSSSEGEISESQVVANIQKRMLHLAEVLELLHKIYCNNKDLYGDRFLAFVGNEVVREWPWKDFPFISKKALDLLEKKESYEDITGKLPFEVKDKSTREVFKNLRYEHWTPISFFRDVFHQHDPIDKETYYHILIKYYRVVWITREEDDLLNKKHRSWRPTEVYDDLGIDIIPHDAWSNISDPSA